ncbi:F-box protein CPR1-like [Solanum dulcamara]|uniref:F-box protein CPR1-like n=1 Tax=Solanum dulcamara TaxID=45834 RepID=UPI00248531AA|nr:F-box protein CPR1-like [Solanum dulcamara]
MEEILMDILSRLPVKSLVRFNCVSKFWNTLISQPYFKKKHLNHAKNQLSSQKLLSLPWPPNDADHNHLHFYSSSLSLVQLVKDIRIFDCPSNSNPREGIKVYCSCDGLFLIGIWTEPHVEQPSILLIWNPSTRESTLLPHSKFMSLQLAHSSSDYDYDYDYEDGSDVGSTYGLGYDSINNDYKVFRMDMSVDGKNEILSLKNGSWRIIEETSSSGRTDCSMLSGGEFLAFVDRAFHWLGILSKLCVVSFNISSEVYREIPLPEIVCSLILSRSRVEVEVDVGVSVLGGTLGVYYKDDGAFNLWVMKDVKDSWTKLFTIPTIEIYRVIPVYMFSDDQVLLYFQLDAITTSRFVYRIISVGSFGLSSQIWPLDCDDIDVVTINEDGIVYTESLVSPKLGK